MRSGFLKGVAITVLAILMLSGKHMVAAIDTVSSGDAVAVEVEENTLSVSVGDACIEESVSDGDLIVIEDEEAALADMPVTVFEETVNGVTICVRAPFDAFEEGTELVVSEVEAVDTVIEKAEQDKQAVVQRCRVFDIIFVKDGVEVEPLNGRNVEVTFEGDMILPAEGEEVTVYHVDEEGVITDVDAVVVSNDAAVEEGEDLQATHLTMVLQ